MLLRNNSKKENKMKKIVKKKWLEALRSGKYRQTQGALCTYSYSGKRRQYCCLGVLCDLHAKETGNKIVNNNGSYEYFNHNVDLPNEVMRWAGILGIDGQFKKAIKVPNEDQDEDPDEYDTLANLNDDAEYNFKQIADVIEKKF